MRDEDDIELRIRPYLVTRGRTAVDPRLRVDSTVLATGQIAPTEIRAEHGHALGLCQRPASIAELAAQLDLPVPLAKVLVTDLLVHSAVCLRATPDEAPDLHILEEVLHGLRRL
ncbi:DUF742 domain-containing protein [Saccharopolyspora endophytica]|uniref:DUF742 domain-containing protein n=1 Tax=Saccharopolyspora endophytica TaxID=543886 RepID=A0ABS5DQM4_9PSEU|nr:DUF742 domain-containing protein [Saccharopolyspora endophytica]MBQ0928604.1 DUF742 domain-containing protein [Saccharopolyspora endophytica]